MTSIAYRLLEGKSKATRMKDSKISIQGMETSYNGLAKNEDVGDYLVG